MTQEFKRTDRVAQMIQRKLAQLIQLEVKDPRLPRLTTVSGVKVSGDLAHAKIYVTVLGDALQVGEALKVLNNAAKYLRTALARSVKLRAIPQLHFVYDESLDYGNKMNTLIKSVLPDEDVLDIDEDTPDGQT